MGESLIRATTDADGGACWEACVEGICLQDRSRQRLAERLAAAVAQPQPPDPEPSSSAPGS